jgi:hypothetical protein
MANAAHFSKCTEIQARADVTAVEACSSRKLWDMSMRLSLEFAPSAFRFSAESICPLTQLLGPLELGVDRGKALRLSFRMFSKSMRELSFVLDLTCCLGSNPPHQKTWH